MCEKRKLLNCDFVRREIEIWYPEEGELIVAIVHFCPFLVCVKWSSLHCGETGQLQGRWKCGGGRYAAVAARRGVTVVFPSQTASVEVKKVYECPPHIKIASRKMTWWQPYSALRGSVRICARNICVEQAVASSIVRHYPSSTYQNAHRCDLEYQITAQLHSVQYQNAHRCNLEYIITVQWHSVQWRCTTNRCSRLQRSVFWYVLDG